MKNSPRSQRLIDRLKGVPKETALKVIRAGLKARRARHMREQMAKRKGSIERPTDAEATESFVDQEPSEFDEDRSGCEANQGTISREAIVQAAYQVSDRLEQLLMQLPQNEQQDAMESCSQMVADAGIAPLGALPTSRPSSFAHNLAAVLLEADRGTWRLPSDLDELQTPEDLLMEVLM